MPRMRVLIAGMAALASLACSDSPTSPTTAATKGVPQSTDPSIDFSKTGAGMFSFTRMTLDNSASARYKADSRSGAVSRVHVPVLRYVRMSPDGKQFVSVENTSTWTWELFLYDEAGNRTQLTYDQSLAESPT